MERVKYLNANLVESQRDCPGVVYTDGPVIAYVGAEDPGLPYDRAVDLQGMTLMPAFIDLHCHLRDPGYPQKETMETGMRAALAGGYATLCAMANTDPVIETPALVEENHRRAGELRLCRLIQAAAVGKGLKDQEPTDWEALSAVTPMLTNDGKNIDSDEFMEKLLRFAWKKGIKVSTHPEPEAEITRRDIAIMRKLCAEEPGEHFWPLHVGHVSLAETMAMIEEALLDGILITSEVTPHHLIGWDMDYRVNPPLRRKAVVGALIKAIRMGTAWVLATDHAPHTPEDKAAGMAGISGIEYAFGIYWHVFHQNGIPLTRLSMMASRRPASVLGLQKVGRLQAGYAADLVIVDPDWTGVIDPETMVSRSHNTPFAGYPLRGKVLTTIVEGEVRYDHGSFVR